MKRFLRLFALSAGALIHPACDDNGPPPDVPPAGQCYVRCVDPTGASDVQAVTANSCDACRAAAFKQPASMTCEAVNTSTTACSNDFFRVAYVPSYSSYARHYRIKNIDTTGVAAGL